MSHRADELFERRRVARIDHDQAVERARERVVVVERSTVEPKVDLVPVDVWLTVSDRGDGGDGSFGFDELDRLVVRLVDERNSA